MFDKQESEKSPLTPELAALEQQLMDLELAPLRLDRDRLMFDAGRAAERSNHSPAATLRVAGASRWFWPTAAAMMTAACVVLAAMLVWRDDGALVAQQQTKPQSEEPREIGIATVDTPSRDELREVERLAVRSGTSIWSTRPTSGYLGMRHVALTRGVGQLSLDPSIIGENGNARNNGDSAKPATARELFQELVPSATRVQTSS
jgi:hypothetical protein